jgi:hypothetical protein
LHPHARFVEGIEHQSSVAEPAGHDVTAGAANERAVAAAADKRVDPNSPRQGIVAVVASTLLPLLPAIEAFVAKAAPNL